MLGAKVFISYRRNNGAGTVHRIYETLKGEVGKRSIFMDVAEIKPGKNFVREIERQVGRCPVFLAVIAPGWSEARTDAGARRLDDKSDYVRLEIATALRRGKTVIPVLVDQARMPAEDEIPVDLRPLTKLMAIQIRNEKFESDVAPLVQAVEEAMPVRSALRSIAISVGLVAVAVVIFFGAFQLYLDSTAGVVQGSAASTAHVNSKVDKPESWREYIGKKADTAVGAIRRVVDFSPKVPQK